MFSLMSCSAEVMNRLTPVMFQEPSSFCDGLGAAGADVGAGVGLGEHHRGAPLAVDDVAGRSAVSRSLPLRWTTSAKAGPARVHPDGALAPSTISPIAQTQARTGRACRRARRAGRRRQYSRVHPGLVALLERLRHGRGAGRRVEDRRVAVAVLVGRGEVLAGEPVDLGEDLARGLAVDLLERAGAEHVVAAEHLEEVELDVAQVALVVTHGGPFRSWRVSACLPVCYQWVTNASVPVGDTVGAVAPDGEPPRPERGILGVVSVILVRQRRPVRPRVAPA